MRANTCDRNGNCNPSPTIRNPQSEIRNRVIRNRMLLAMALLLALAGNAAAQYAGGAGVDGNPYLIATVQDLLDLSNPANSADWDKHFRMTADINMDGITGFTPIGNNTTKFRGVFDGDGHVIRNLVIDLPTQDYVGLFGHTDGVACYIRNLGMDFSTVIGKNNVGGLAGYNKGGTITGCYAIGAVSGAGYSGGLTGSNEGGTITGCYAIGAVSGAGCVGGLSGSNIDGTITGCYATGTVIGEMFDLIGTEFVHVGGLIGSNSGSSTIIGCYAIGDVVATGSTGNINAGGLVGSANGTITGCYATGAVTGSGSYVGGLVGSAGTSAISQAFWDMETTGQQGSSGGKGLTSAEMTQVSIFQNAGWSAYGWVMTEGAWPRLAWENTGAPPIPDPTPLPLPGIGTMGDPYRVSTHTEFAMLSWHVDVLNAHILLTQDLDCTGVALSPIGDLGPFTGVFDGNNKTIANVILDYANSDFIGVFAFVGETGELRDLGIVDTDITGRFNVGGLVGKNSGTITGCCAGGAVEGIVTVGGLVGHMSGGIVEACSASVSVLAYGKEFVSRLSSLNHKASSAGGLVGYLSDNAIIKNSSAKGSVVSEGQEVGGLVGRSRKATVENSFAVGAVVGNGAVGGLIGHQDSYSGAPTVRTSFALGAVKGLSDYTGNGTIKDNYVGGLVGKNMGTIFNCYASGIIKSSGDSVGGLVGSGGTITNCYATGAVMGNERVGGLVGSGGTVTNCYATGAVAGNTNLGGLVGLLESGSVSASFWDITTGGPDNGMGTGLPTTLMRQRVSFESAGWDFVGTWYTLETLTYPQLTGIPMPVDSIGVLQALAQVEAKSFFLTQDIDARATAGWGEKSVIPGFHPIGTTEVPFNGTLDGQGHRIFGLHIQRPNESAVGLFGHIGADGVVRGIGLNDVTITGGYQTGGLAGVNAGTVEQCYVQGAVAGIQEVGGLVGANSGTVSESYAATTLDGVAPGGLVGLDEGGNVTASFWDTMLSGVLVSGGGAGLDTVAMQSSAAYANDGWDMTGIWTLSEGLSYPYFRNSAPLRILTGPPLLIDADSASIEVMSFLPGVFVTVGGGAYPAWHRFVGTGTASIEVPLKQEALNTLTVSVISETGVEQVLARYRVYESVAFPSVPTEVTSLAIEPMSLSLALGATHQFHCVATFADSTTAYVTPVANWNVSGGTITSAGLYTHRGSTGTVQALLHTQDGWRSSNVAVVTTAKGASGDGCVLSDDVGPGRTASDTKSDTGRISGVMRSHYTGLGLPSAQVTVYHVFAPGVAGQFGVWDTLGNYAFPQPEGVYHFEATNPGYRSELLRGGRLIRQRELIHPGPPEEWSEAEYSGQVKADRPLQHDFSLRPNDAQAPWVYYVEPPASCTVNNPLLVVTAINADKYSELDVATFTLNTNTHDVRDRISTTGFYRNTWMLEPGLNVLHLYSMDTEGNAAERTIEVIYDPEYDPSGDEPPEPEGPPETNCVRMAFVNLTDGLAVRGNAVTLWAEVVEGDLSAVDAVSFEARGAGTGGTWHVIDTSLAAPHVVAWNADAYPQGAYQMRAVAISLDGCVDSHAAVVEVTVDPGAAYYERVDAGVHTLTTPVSAASDTVLALWDGVRFARILLPAGALGSDDTLTAFFPNAADFTPALTPWQQDAELYLDVRLANHTGDFLNDKHATLEVGYPDANGDGLLDGSGLPVSQLALRHLPAPSAAFAVLPASRVSWSRQCVIGETRHFSVFGVVAEQPAPPLNLMTQSLPDGTQGVAYSVALEANGGIPPYSWTVSSGALPDGLSINGNILEGVPAAPGIFSFTLQISDAQSIPSIQSINLSLTIFEAAQPTVMVTRAAAQPGMANTLPIQWDIVFSEPVSGFTASDVVFRGSAAFGLGYTLTGTDDAYALEVTAMPYDGTLRPTVPANAAGNNNQPSAGEEQVWVDRKAPLAVFGRLYPGGSVTTTDTLPIAFSLTFDESVTGLDVSGIIFSAEVSGVVHAIQGSGRDYTLVVTGASGASDIMPVLLAGAAQDAAGNGNPEISYDGPTVQYTSDARPTVTLNQASGQSDPTKDFPIVFEIGFSEAVSGFTVDDVEYLDLPDKAPNPVYTLGGGGASYMLTVTGADGDGRLGFRVPETDDWRASTSMDNVVTLDTTLPTVSIGAPSIGQTLRGPVSFPVQYTGATTVTLSASDVSLHGAPTAQVTVTGTGTASRVVTLSGIDGVGTLAISLAAGTATDSAGNLAPAAGPSSTVEISPFTVTVARAPGQAPLTNGLPIAFDVVFNRAATNFDASDVHIGGTASGVSFDVSGSGASYTISITAVDGDGSIIASIPADVCEDLSGTLNESSTGADNSVTYDTERPDVVVSRADGQPALTNTLPIVFDVLFTKSVFGFDDGSVHIGGTAAGVDFDVTGEDNSYTITITAITNDGTVVVTVPANQCQDGAGNGNTASTGATNSVTYDITPPEFLDIAATPSPAGADAVVELMFRASEALDGLPTVTVNGNTAAYVSHDGLYYAYSYTIQAGDPNGAATIAITGADPVGNLGETINTDALLINHTKPTANFSASPRAGMPPLEVTFTDLSTPVSGTPITDWQWDFGDGTPPVSGQSPAPHSYADAGVYTVTLTITDSATNSDSAAKTGYIVVGGPAAGFTATPTTGHAPMTVQFTDTSAPGAEPITTWQWVFGDGATSDEADPTHTYTDVGVYDVSLTVTTAVTNDTHTAYGHITVQSGIPPTAGFSATPTTGYAPLSILFTDTSTPGSHDITSWQWDFGDGETSEAPAPAHTYATPGVYNVILTVTTAAGYDALTRLGYVHVLAPTPPTAAFTATPRSGVAPLTVQFEDASNPGTSPIVVWHWDFGDGATSDDPAPSHTYTTPGVYDVTLTVTTNVTSDTRTEYGHIAALQSAGPVANFGATPTRGAAPLVVRFTDLSIPGAAPIDHWHWDFGDGMTSAEPAPSHTYAMTGVYDVTLTVTTAVDSDMATRAGYIEVFSALPAGGLLCLVLLVVALSVCGAKNRLKAEG